MTAPRVMQPDSSALWHSLSAAQRTILLRAATSATEEGGAAFLVGGPVRDLLRGETHLRDIDIVTTADARLVAQRFASRDGAVVAKVTDFGTATVHCFDDTGDIAARVDFATARTEAYPHAGALPVVSFPARIDDDLHRRDVTINAMALPITPHGFADLLDPISGLPDLRAGIIRVLHDATLEDDPTRLYRVARYAARFRFTIEPHTAALIHAAVAAGALTTISADRKRHELELGLREADPVACFTAFDAYGLLRATSPVLIWDRWVAARLPLVAPSAWPAWALFVCRQEDTAVERLLIDLAVRTGRAEIRHLVRVWRERDVIATTARLSPLRPLLEKLSKRVVLVLLDGDPASQRAEAFYERLRHVQWQDIHQARSFGNYLKDLGIAPGPVYRDILGALRDARLDGDVETLDDAFAWIRTYLTEHGLAPAP